MCLAMYQVQCKQISCSLLVPFFFLLQFFLQTNQFSHVHFIWFYVWINLNIYMPYVCKNILRIYLHHILHPSCLFYILPRYNIYFQILLGNLHWVCSHTTIHREPCLNLSSTKLSTIEEGYIQNPLWVMVWL